MLTQVSLVDGANTMILRPRDGIAVSKLDLGFPGIREVVEDRTDTSGALDTTSFHGASAVTLTLTLFQQGTTRALIDELRSYCGPSQRPYLVVSDDEWTSGDRRIQLRADQQSAPIESGKGALREVQVGWKAPDGIWETAAPVTVTLAADIASTVGLSWPVTWPIAYTPTQAVGAATITNPGVLPVHWVARLYGPCTAPALRNESLGVTLAFTAGLTLNAGDYIEVNSRDRSAYLLSDASQSRLNLLDFVGSNWWQIQPGDQQIRYAPGTASAGASASITYRPAWL